MKRSSPVLVLGAAVLVAARLADVLHGRGLLPADVGLLIEAALVAGYMMIALAWWDASRGATGRARQLLSVAAGLGLAWPVWLLVRRELEPLDLASSLQAGVAAAQLASVVAVTLAASNWQRIRSASALALLAFGVPELAWSLLGFRFTFVAAGLTVVGAAALLAVAREIAQERTEDPDEAKAGFLLASRAILLRPMVIVGVFGFASKLGSGVHGRITTMIAMLALIASLAGFVVGIARVVRSSLAGVSRLQLAAGCGLLLASFALEVKFSLAFCTGHPVLVTHLDAVLAWAPAAAMLGSAIITHAIGRFANARAFTKLRAHVTRSTAAFLLMSCIAIAIQPQAFAGGGLSILYLVLALVAQFLLGVAIGEAAKTLARSVELPTAIAR